MFIEGTLVINDGEVPVTRKEAEDYILYLERKYEKSLCSLHINLDNEFADLHFRFMSLPFERIRRITGYLVGDTNTWNDAKRAELVDRVQHGLNVEVI